MPIRYADLTARQLDALRAVLAHIERHGEPPTIFEVSVAMGFSHKMASYPYLNALESKGYVRRIPGAPRGLMVLKGMDGRSAPSEEAA